MPKKQKNQKKNHVNELQFRGFRSKYFISDEPKKSRHIKKKLWIKRDKTDEETERQIQ